MWESVGWSGLSLYEIRECMGNQRVCECGCMGSERVSDLRVRSENENESVCVLERV